MNSVLVFTRGLSSATAAVTKIHRLIYARLYKGLLVQPDGSTIRIRYQDPRLIIKLPLDLSDLTEEQRLKRIADRKPKKKVKIEDDLDYEFDAKKYLQFVKKVKK